jgi:hypothetical protein
MTEQRPEVAFFANEGLHRWQTLLLGEKQADIARVLEGSRFEADILGRMMTVSAAIVGVVVPLLAGRPMVASPRWLWRRAVVLLVNVAVGVIIHGILRWLMAHQRSKLTAHYTALSSAMTLVATTKDELGTLMQMTKVGDAFIEWADRFRRRWLIWAGVADVVFYGTLLAGLACVVRSVFA